MNVNKYKWHIYSFDKWFNEFFIPIIHDHHNNEEKISFPFYMKLEKIEMPKKQCQDHNTLFKGLDEIKVLLKEIISIVSSSESSESLITTKSNELQTKFDSSMHHMFEHLSDEEKFWPSIYEKHGVKNIAKDESNIVNSGMISTGIEAQAFKMIFASMVTAIGTTLNSSSTNKYGTIKYTIKPFASKELSMKFHNRLPSFPKLFIFPNWLDLYEKYSVLLDSLNGDEDKMEFLFPSQKGCTCIIS